MILPILLIALLIRIIGLDQSLWLDEGINVIFATNLDFKSLVFSYSLGDFHPPLYHLILKSQILLLGNSEISVRLPSIIFGLGTVYITYLIGRKIFDERTGLIASILLATSPLHIYYSQEARMYSMAAFFASLSVFSFISLLKKDKIQNWALFIVSTSLMLYSDYVPYFMLIVYSVFLIFFRKNLSKSTLLSFIPASILIAILTAPWFLIFPKQLETGLSAATNSPAWANVVGTPTVKNLALTFVKFTIGRISNNNNLEYFLLFLPVAAYMIFIFLISFFRISKIRSFLFFWLLLPVFLAFIISFIVPVFAYFRFIFILPAFCLIWASAIYTVNWKIPLRVLLFVALFINLTATTIYLLNPKFQREDWKKATSYVHTNSTPDTIVLFESTSSIAPFDYYNKSQILAIGILDSFSPQEAKVRTNIQNSTAGKNKVFLFQYLSGITDQEGLAFQELTRSGFQNTKTTDFTNIGFLYEFTR